MRRYRHLRPLFVKQRKSTFDKKSKKNYICFVLFSLIRTFELKN